MATIKEIAVECGVSEQAIRSWCRRNHVAKDNRGSFAISESVKTLICQYYSDSERNHVAKDTKAKSETFVSPEMVMISTLQQQLEVKDKQIAAQQEQIAQLTAALEHTTSSLHAAQALHAGTIQQQLQEAAGHETPSETAPSADETPPEPRRGFWARLLGK